MDLTRLSLPENLFRNFVTISQEAKRLKSLQNMSINDNDATPSDTTFGMLQI